MDWPKIEKLGAVKELFLNLSVVSPSMLEMVNYIENIEIREIIKGFEPELQKELLEKLKETP